MSYSDYEAIIGIEIHLELSTKTKMFSYAENNFNLPENTSASVIDLGYPGTLPLLNKQAVIFGIKLAKALNMTIDHELHFDRKNYFYPDLPKGYQITQQFRPIGKEGIIPIEIDNKTRNIEIERIHLEEDTAKQIHEGNKTYLNYNRAGVPLIEIVSKPVMRNGKEAAEYINNIRLTALSLAISDAKMNEGSLRADVNVSVRKKGSQGFNTRVEIKNLNSISNVEKAIDYEFKWQVDMMEANKSFEQQTKRFDEATQTTKTMRSKSSAVDYKYFAEPNIPFVTLTQQLIDSVIVDELPWDRKKRYLSKGLNNVQIEQLLKNMDYCKYIDSLAKDISVPFKKITNIFFSDIVSFLNTESIDLKDLKISENDLASVINDTENGKLQKHAIGVVLTQKQHNPTLKISEIIESNDLKAKDLSVQIEADIDDILASNPDMVAEYATRPERVLKFVVGQVMKRSKGQANPVQAKEILLKKLGAN